MIIAPTHVLDSSLIAITSFAVVDRHTLRNEMEIRNRIYLHIGVEQPFMLPLYSKPVFLRIPAGILTIPTRYDSQTFCRGWYCTIDCIVMPLQHTNNTIH